MGLDHLEPHYTDEAAPFIAEAGGKIGGLVYLGALSTELNTRILPIQLLGPGERFREPKVPAGDFGQYIVRGSHPMDFQGLVDVLTTKVGMAEDLRSLVAEAQGQARTRAVMDYGRYENPAYDGNIMIGIQPYLNTQRGSIVEHPNIPNSYVVSFVDPGEYKPGQRGAITGIYNGETDKIESVSGGSDEIVGDADTRYKRVVELYRLVDESGLVRPGFSFQMEFLNASDAVYIAQVRAFMQKQQADFRLDARERVVFGITPREGIVVPVYLSPNGFLGGEQPNQTSPWAYFKPCEPNFNVKNFLKSDAEQQRDKLRFRPQNLAAYLIGQSFSNHVYTTLEHNHFSVAQKADLTIFEDSHSRHDFTRLITREEFPPESKVIWDNWVWERAYLEDVAEAIAERHLLNDQFLGYRGKARIISDGRTAIVDPVEAS